MTDTATHDALDADGGSDGSGTPPSGVKARLARVASGQRATNLSWRWQLGIGVLSLAVAVGILAKLVDTDVLVLSLRAMAQRPLAVVGALGAFGLAFVVRAGIWSRVLPDLPFRQALGALHLSLGANHVLPLRMGEPVRILSVVRRTPLDARATTASAITLRSADILAMALLGWVLAPAAFASLLGGWGALVLGVVLLVGAAAVGWLAWLRSRSGLTRIRLPGPIVAAGSLAAWALEAVLVLQSARFVGIDLSYSQAVLVTCVAVAAQTVAIAPGGIGTYEAATVAAYATLGVDPAAGLAAALTAHALKTAYSLVAGGIAVVRPRPSLLGRIRLPKRADATPNPTDPTGVVERVGDGAGAEGVVVLFLPAHDEEDAVAGVVARAPRSVLGHPVEVVVIDDGSTDATAVRAADAGATVVRLGENRGLGAAVRTGLRYAVERDAVAVAFCDADGEYAPEELEHLVAPILGGTDDYVVGSRFAGTIRSMRWHRRFGNVVLTRVVRFMSRQPVTDGQSGYRALAPDAARHASIIHDFNYAQVLTLDLVGKGYRYDEVPITYAFRTTGRSFVRLWPYLRKVVPAWYRELNDSVDPASRTTIVDRGAIDAALRATIAREAGQSSTTLPANESVAAAQLASSNEPSARSESAAAQPIASA